MHLHSTVIYSAERVTGKARDRPQLRLGEPQERRQGAGRALGRCLTTRNSSDGAPSNASRRAFGAISATSPSPRRRRRHCLSPSPAASLALLPPPRGADPCSQPVPVLSRHRLLARVAEDGWRCASEQISTRLQLVSPVTTSVRADSCASCSSVILPSLTRHTKRERVSREFYIIRAFRHDVVPRNDVRRSPCAFRPNPSLHALASHVRTVCSHD